MKRKTIALLLILAFMVMQLTACGFHGSNTEEYKTPNRLSIEMLIKIIDCYKQKDKDTLKGFFSQDAMEQCPELEQQIEASFTLFDGEITSYDEPDGNEGGPFDEKSYYANTDIVTDRGTEYYIAFHGYLRYDQDKSKEGISYIKIANSTEYDRHEEDERDEYLYYFGTDIPLKDYNVPK